MDGARQWLQIAANGGHVRAMTLLGLYYAEFGDRPSAIRWLTSAADAGDESAMNFLGAMYDGRGDLAAAVHWWGMAAQLGNLPAMYNLGELLIAAGYTQDGEGWVRAAAEAGHARAMTRLGELVARSTIPEQRPEPERAEPEPWYGGGTAASLGYDPEPRYGYERDDPAERAWYGTGQEAYPPEPTYAAAPGLVATAGVAATPAYSYLDQPGRGI
jgi:TPR repeat protein